MLSRVTAEFETPDLAEYAVNRIKRSVEYVYSAKLMFDPSAFRTERQSRNSTFRLIPTYCNTHSNFLTAVMDSPASQDIIPEPKRNTQTTACIICGSAAVDNVISLLNAMGALNIRFAQ